MNYFHRIGNALARFMYGRNGLDQMNLALIWGCVILDVIALLAKKSPVTQTILYYAGIVLWIWVIFRMFSKNLYKRREENSKFMTFI
jgi:threonine/homoserine/homoserine lactone efflux protein